MTSSRKQSAVKSSGILYEIPGNLNLSLQPGKIVSREIALGLQNSPKYPSMLGSQTKSKNAPAKKLDFKAAQNAQKKVRIFTGSNQSMSPAAAERKSQMHQFLPVIRTSQDCVVKAFPDSTRSKKMVLSVTRDPLDREIEEVFQKRMVRVNKRVKVSLYTPSKLKQIVIPDKLLSSFKTKSRYSSVDETRYRNSALNQTAKRGNVETSLSKFVNVQTNKFSKGWRVIERPDEMLKRYLRMKKKEQKLEARHRQQIDIDDVPIIVGCQEMLTHNTIRKSESKDKTTQVTSKGKPWFRSLHIYLGFYFCRPSIFQNGHKS